MSVFRPTILIAASLALCACEPKATPDVEGGETAAQPSISAAPTAGKNGAAADKPLLPGSGEVFEVTLKNQAMPYHGLVTAGQPTTEQFTKLKAAGYTAVINLRTEGEEGYVDFREQATRNTLLYSHIPIDGAEGLTRANVDKFADTLESPMAENGKVLVYCGSSNRAGAMVALKAKWIDGRSAKDALELGKKAGLLKLEDAVKAKLAE